MPKYGKQAPYKKDTKPRKPYKKHALLTKLEDMEQGERHHYICR